LLSLTNHFLGWHTSQNGTGTVPVSYPMLGINHNGSNRITFNQLNQIHPLIIRGLHHQTLILCRQLKFSLKQYDVFFTA
jgi:hypothetical protein